MNRNYIAFNDVTVPAGRKEMIVMPGANFIRCLDSKGRRFLLSINGQPAVPCWGGWYFGLGAGETASRLVVTLLPGDTEPLHVEFMHGLGIFDDKQLQIVHDYAVASKIRMAVPTRVETFSFVTATNANVFTSMHCFDEDDNAQEVIVHYFPYSTEGGSSTGVRVVTNLISSSATMGENVLLHLNTVRVPANDDRIHEMREVRLKFGGELWFHTQKHYSTLTIDRPIHIARLLLNAS